MSYIKKVEITGADITGGVGNYLKRVEIVEVLDSEGNPWEPVPGPDPWDELVVQKSSYYSAHNSYTCGSEIFGHPGTFIGGNPDNTTYRWRWQYQAAGSSNWINSSWTSYNNTSVIEVNFFIPDTAEGGKVRLHAQARDVTDPDNVDQVNSFAPTEDVEWKPLELVSSPGISGAVFAGEYLTGTKAVYAHGVPPVEVQSQIQISPDGTSSWTGVDAWGAAENGQHRIAKDEVGKYFRVAGRGIDQSENAISQADTLMSFSEVVGPAGQYTVGDVTGYVDGVEYDPQATTETVLQGQSQILHVTNTGNSPNINYSWTVRQGDIRLTPSGSSCTIVHQSEPPQGAQVQVDLIDNYTSDDNKSVRFAFLVTE